MELGYKGQMKQLSDMFVDHMHQPWRTLGTIINRCLSGKMSSNDRLRLSRVEILWGMYHKENVDYAALIWEDLQYQIDNWKSKVRRREIMPYPRFTKIIIHYFLSQHKSISKRQGSLYNTSEDDGVLGRLKFISKGKEHQLYGKPIPYILVTDDIRNSEAYNTFIALSTGLIPPKKGRGKGAQGTKATVIPKKAIVASKKKRLKKKESSGDESDESDAEPANRPTCIRKPRGASITPEVPDEPTGKSAVLYKGAGISLEVSDEVKDKSEAQDDLDDWGSTDDETLLFDDKDEQAEEIPWVSTDDDEVNDESIDIENTDDERTKSDNDDYEMTDAVKIDVGTLVEENADKEHEENAEKVEEQKVDEEKKNEMIKLRMNKVSDLEKDVKELKQVDHSTTTLESIKSQVPSVVNKYLGSSLGDTLQKVLRKHTKELKQQFSQKDVSEIIKVKQEHVAKEKMLKYSTTQFDQAVDDEYSLLVDENNMDKLVVDPLSKKKIRHEDKDQDPRARSDQGMKKRRIGKDAEPSMKSSKSKDLLKAKLDNVANDVDEPQVDAIPKSPKQDWFTQPPSLETPNLDWNTIKTVDDAPEQSWYYEMIQAEKPPLMFDELMSTCKSCVELEYNMEECYRALTDQLDWINPKGHKSPVDMSKPLPLKDKEGRLTIPVEFFFNNDLEYLKARNLERKYSSSITKTPAARYIMEGIEDMILTMWSPVIITYDKDAALRISHWGPQCQLFYRAMINRVYKHEVFSTMRILSVVSVQIEKKSSYDYLKEIVVKRADQKLYKFKSKLHKSSLKFGQIACFVPNVTKVQGSSLWETFGASIVPVGKPLGKPLVQVSSLQGRYLHQRFLTGTILALS
ncbi:hypothetical protein Tco_0026441 [Tanacetum coccineum]